MSSATDMKTKCNAVDCKKKLGICPIKCRCDMLFCDKHRLPEVHNCSYDYKTTGKQKLQLENQPVIYEKIIKI